MSFFRRVKLSDLPIVDRIWRKFHKTGFGIPGRNHVVTQGVVESHGKVIAYGQVKAFCEAIMVLDLEEPTREKIEAVRKLMEIAIMDSTNTGYEQMHVFVQDPEFAKILKKHFGFQPCSGEALVLNL